MFHVHIHYAPYTEYSSKKKFAVSVCPCFLSAFGCGLHRHNSHLFVVVLFCFSPLLLLSKTSLKQLDNNSQYLTEI